MVELRWVERVESDRLNGSYLVRALQYRTRLPEPGYVMGTEFGGLWSDWRDVPTAIQQNPSVLDNSDCTTPQETHGLEGCPQFGVRNG